VARSLLLHNLHYSHALQHTVSVVWQIADDASSLFLLLWPSAKLGSDNSAMVQMNSQAPPKEPSQTLSSQQLFGRKAVGR